MMKLILTFIVLVNKSFISLIKGPNSINELFVVEHYTAKVPFHFRDKC